MNNQLHCFGTAGYHPNDNRHTSSYFLPQSGIALDAGSGFYRAFPLIKTPELHVLLSHAHLDHIVGLTFLWNAYRNRTLRQVHVYGEADKLQAIREHIFSDLIFPALPNIQWHVIEPHTDFDIQGIAIKPFPLQHPGGSLGYRLTHQQCSLAYVSDTTTSLHSHYWNTVRDVDLLLHECNFRTSEADTATKTGHTDWGTLATCLSHYAIRRTLLTHFNTIDDCLSGELNEFAERITADSTQQVMLAYDGLVVDF